EAWVKTSGTGNWQRLVGKGRDGTNMVWELSLTSSGQVVFSIPLNANNGSVAQLFTSATINDGAWHHVVATVDPALGQFIYLDGAQSANHTGVYTLLTNAEPLSLGADYLRGEGYFGGSLDDVAVYDAALSATQIAAHYALRTNGGTSGTGAVRAQIS